MVNFWYNYPVLTKRRNTMVDQSLVVMKDLPLGTRMKCYEAVETKRRFERNKPIYARIDGRGFSKFTKGMKRPYEEEMSKAMIEVTKYLVKETGAVVGYTQSDEISLAWFGDDTKTAFFFDGKIQKMVSNVAALATAKFMTYAAVKWPEACEQKLPTFDSRIISMPSFEEVANMFLWRVMDARKNSISMAARAFFSHKSILNKNGADKIEMLKEAGIDFEAYPEFFKHGTFVRNEKFFVSIEDSSIPLQYREGKEGVYRNKIVEVPVTSFMSVENKVPFMFYGEQPKLIEKPIFLDTEQD